MALILIQPSTTVTGSGPTLIDLVNRLADELGYRLTTTVSTQATTGEATRIVLANEARDDETGGDGAWDFMGEWLYAFSPTFTGTQRRILNQDGVGWQGNLGAMLVSRPFSSALLAGTSITVTSPLPVRRHLGVLGLVECLNQGLAKIWVPARITLTGNGTYEYDLAAYPWLEQALDQMRGIYDAVWQPTTISPQLSGFGYRVVTNGVTRTLVTDFLYSSGQTFYLDVVVRGDRLIYDGASWSYVTTPGLVHDADQTAAPVHWAIAFGMVQALRFLTRWLGQRRMDASHKQALMADVTERRQNWTRAARLIMQSEFPALVPRPRKPILPMLGTAASWNSQPGWS